jgi:Nitroreductase
MMNETLQSIKNRFACRGYTAEMPSDEHLRLITEAAVQAPSGRNEQHWRIHLIKNPALMQEMEAAGMAVITADEDKTLLKRVESRGGKMFYNAPCMIVVAVEEGPHIYAELDCGIVCQNITLAAESLGMASIICAMVSIPLWGETGPQLMEKIGIGAGWRFGMGVLLGFAEKRVAPHEPDLPKIVVIE